MKLSSLKNRVFVKFLVLLFFLTLTGKTFSQTAHEKNHLPKFTVKDLEGAEVPSSHFGARSKWMLIYLESNCSSCFELLETFNQSKPISDLGQKVVVIVAGVTAKKVKQLAHKTSWIPAEAWYVDQNYEVTSALDLKGSPMTIGFRENYEEWRLAGFPKEENSAETIILNWFKE